MWIRIGWMLGVDFDELRVWLACWLLDHSLRRPRLRSLALDMLTPQERGDLLGRIHRKLRRDRPPRK